MVNIRHSHLSIILTGCVPHSVTETSTRTTSELLAAKFLQEHETGGTLLLFNKEEGNICFSLLLYWAYGADHLRCRG
jgi:hypothetical protein